MWGEQEVIGSRISRVDYTKDTEREGGMGEKICLKKSRIMIGRKKKGAPS